MKAISGYGPKCLLKHVHPIPPPIQPANTCAKFVSFFTDAMSRAAFLALPGLLQEKLEDIFSPPDVEVSKTLSPQK